MSPEIVFFIMIAIVALPPYWLLYRLYRHTKTFFEKEWPLMSPPVTVIIPCKGGDLTFRENLQSLLRQNYPDFEVIFVTATEDDPARGIIQELMLESKVQTRLLIAGISPHCGQKMNNMICGVKAARPSSEVFVFLDGDVYIHPDYLAEMVKPLSDPNTGTSCGYHMFVPTKNSLGAFLRFEWSFGGLLVLPDSRRNFSIGAATGIRKDIFDKAKILDRLKTTISDTFCFTNGVRSLGLKVHFEPKCLFVSYDQSSLQEMFSWSNRLTIISRNYSPELWYMTVFSFTLSVFLLMVGLIITLVSFDAMIFLGIGILLLLQIVHSQLSLLFLKFMAEDRYPEQLRTVLKKWLILTLMAPVIPFVISWNCVNSIFRNEFTWRGVRYRIRGASSVEVLS